MNKILIGLGAVIAVLVIVASSSLFIVEQTQQAIVLFFGKPQETIREPGLYVKVPFAEEVVYYEKRVLDLDPPKERMILADQKRLDVDSYRDTELPIHFYFIRPRVVSVRSLVS